MLIAVGTGSGNASGGSKKHRRRGKKHRRVRADETRPDDLCDLQSLNTNSSLQPMLSDSFPQTTQQPPQNPPQAPTSPGNTLTCTEDRHESAAAPPTTTLPTETTPPSSPCVPHACSPTPKSSPFVDPVDHPPPAPLPPPVTPQIFSQSSPSTSNPAYSPSKSPPNVNHNITQNSSRLPHRTLPKITQSLSGGRTPPPTPHNITHNASELPSLPAKAPPSPPLSPSHPDPFLMTSVTFTSSVSSHLYSPVCSSPTSVLRSLDSLAPPIGLLPQMTSATPQLTTPPPTLSPPPPELIPPPAQLLGSDDEEQEDPSDYCKVN